MELRSKLDFLANKLKETQGSIKTEEATKTSLVMPFISALGYDVFDPRQVLPELVADTWAKRGEKVDYAILMDGAPVVLFECKKLESELSVRNASQLQRYFNMTQTARFGVLTNGKIYQFFSDLDVSNVMDTTPFLELDITNLTDPATAGLEKFCKSVFNSTDIIGSAHQSRFVNAIKTEIQNQFNNPSEPLIRLIATSCFPDRRFTQGLRDQMAPVVKDCLEHIILERINQRLLLAASAEEDSRTSSDQSSARAAVDNRKFFSQEENEGFLTIRGMLSSHVDPARITYRDTQLFCRVILDGTPKKTLVVMYFKKVDRLRISIPGYGRHRLNAVGDLINFRETITSVLGRYLAGITLDSEEELGECVDEADTTTVVGGDALAPLQI